jgi:plasmid stability protein
MQVLQMPRMIQIRDVPDRLHRRLKARAAAVGMTMSDYLRAELERVAAQLTADESRQRLEALAPVAVDEPPAAAVRRERDPR